MKLTRRSMLRTAAALPLAGGLGLRPARAAEPIKVGILHSLSGTMAISETILKDLMLMEISDLNAQGGLLGRPIQPVVVDPASNWPLFAEKARELLTVDKVAVVFGCWTSVSRKSVLPVFEELNGLLYYPLEYEGEEQSQQCVLWQLGARQQGDPGVEIPDERRRRLGDALRAGGHRLRLSAHQQRDHARLPEVRGRRGRGHHGELHAVRLRRLADRGRHGSRSSVRPARRRRWSPPSTATPTCRSTRNWPTRASRRRIFR